MSHEELEQKYLRLVDQVRQMRGWQKEYFKYHASQALQNAKRKEREVDNLIAEEVARQKSKQKELF
jgi:hypothetical protein